MTSPPDSRGRIVTTTQEPGATTEPTPRRRQSPARHQLTMRHRDDRITEIDRVIDAIHADHSVLLTVDDMAAIVRYSRFHFIRLFSARTARFPAPMLGAYGVTARAYQTIARLEHAKRLLTTTGKTASDIAVMVGFSGIGNFSPIFTNAVGIPPTEYRNRTTGTKTTPRGQGAEARINLAKTLLTTTSMPVAEISSTVGYTHRTSLANAFKQQVGMAPQTYRRQHLRQKNGGAR